MAKVKSNAHIYITRAGAAAPTNINITSVTDADPAVVTLAAAVPAGTAVGDFLVIDGTGQALLDGQAFRITALNVTTPAAPVITLDFDGTDLTAAVGAVGHVNVFTKNVANGTLVEACMANITVSGVAPDSIDMDDMCGTSTVLGDAKPPTFSFSGFVDSESEGFKELIRASLESPKQGRTILIDYGADVGYIFGPGEIGEVTVTAGVGQGLQFSGSGVFTEVPTYSWAL